MRWFVILSFALAAAACQQDPIEVRPGGKNDYNAGEMQEAIAKFVEAKRTPAAYAELWRTILALRPGMDRATAQQAELSVVVLALGPLEELRTRPMSEQMDALATTVWPILLAKRLEADEILRKRDPDADLVLPTAGESPRAYIQRLCGKQLAATCKQLVAELQGHVVAALAVRRGTERARIAVADCMLCPAEPGWKAAVQQWEAIDREVSDWLPEIERQGDPANWPIAGAASEPDPGLPEAQVTATGEIVIGGQRYGAAERIAALRDLRFLHGDDSPIVLHLRPEISLAAVKGTLADVRKSGASRIAVLARSPSYPWERRIYWLSDRAGVRVGLRPTDTLQLLLHAIDFLGQPGAVARVD
jgi:hypothetical protein